MARPKNFSREEVLQKAIPVFWKRGFSDTSVHDLERATGVNKSGLYAEFRDKEDLFVESLRYYIATQEKRGLLTAQPLAKGCCETRILRNSCFEPVIFVEKRVLEALVGVDCLTGNLPRPDRFRWSMGLRGGWIKIARRPRTIEGQRCKRHSAKQIESHSCDN